MVVNPSQGRIYLNPPRFWAATRNMSEKDVDAFADKIFRLAAEGRVEELGRYDFISFGHKRHPSQANLKPA